MKPFPAWLAMSDQFGPVNGFGHYALFSDQHVAERFSEAAPQPVLIVADTPENRKKLGMEEG